MQKIVITINNSILYFNYNQKSDQVTKSLINTNVINNNELIFSDQYIKHYILK